MICREAEQHKQINRTIAPDRKIVHGCNEQNAELLGFTGLASLAVPAHRQLGICRAFSTNFALPRSVVEKLRIQIDTGVW